MLRRKKAKAVSPNPEVQEAMDERDELLDNIAGAVDKVDRLVQEYMKANGVHDVEGEE